MSAAESKAVFLSYASQDAEAAKRICEALRQAGVEVWFDQNELVGGDAWDAKIRKQIGSCALFVPIISANTQARAEGYFRLEWKLAVDRSHLMADDQPFLFPVVIDDTSDALARVPERFRERQWMRLDLKDSPESLAARVSQILAPHPPNTPAIAPPHPTRRRPPAPSTRPAWLRPLFILFGLGLAAFYGIWPLLNRPASTPDGTTPPTASTPAAPLTEAGRLVERAEAILVSAALTRESIETANKLLEQAIALEPNHAAAWTQAARADLTLIFPYRYDRSPERRQQAMTRATRAFNLAPDDFPTRIIFETVMAHASDNPGLIREAEAWFRTQIPTHPNESQLSVRLADILREQSRYEEAAAVFTQAGESELAGWSWLQAGDYRAAYAQVKQAAQTRPSPSVYLLKALIELHWFQDLDQAQATFAQLRSSEMFNELVAPNAILVSFYRRDWDNVLTLINALPRDFIESAGYTGPKQYFGGWAHRLSGREARARIEWEKALALLRAESAAQPEREQLIVQQATMEALLQRPDDARRLLQVAAELSGQPPEVANPLATLLTYLALRDDERVLAIAERILREKTEGWIVIGMDARFAPDWDHLRGNSRFEKLLRETAPEDAKPFDGAQGRPFDDPVATFPRDPQLKQAFDLVNSLEANPEDFLLAEDLANPLAHYAVARFCRNIGRPEEMEAALDRALALYPLTNAILWKAYLAFIVRGDLDEMAALLAQVPARMRNTERAVIARFEHALNSAVAANLLVGDRDTAITLLREALTPPGRTQEHLLPEEWAAFAPVLRRTLRIWFAHDPRLAAWRDDPEIQALLAPPLPDV